jgi:hypothetical protein
MVIMLVVMAIQRSKRVRASACACVSAVWVCVWACVSVASCFVEVVEMWLLSSTYMFLMLLSKH